MSLKKEFIKDSIIDYLYDYCHNEKVKVIKGGGYNLEIENDYPVEDDTVMSSLIEEVKNAKGIRTFGFGTRTKEYARVSTPEGVYSSFLNRMERLGYPRKSVSKKEIDNIIQFLCDKSYLVRNLPIEYEVKLTKKGIYHYENGNSFVKDYYTFKLIRRANWISLISAIIAIISLIITFLI